jgi:hypothetical protein
MATIPKIIRLNTRLAKDGKTLFFGSNQDTGNHSRWKRWDTVVSSIEHYHKWKECANVKYIILSEMSENDIEFLEKEKLFDTLYVFTTSKVTELRPAVYWQSKQSVTFLDELMGAYAFIEKAWNGSLQDAVACICLLLNYNKLIGWEGSIERSVQLIEQGIKYEKYVEPPMLYIITQYFVHSISKRAREIRRCLMNNSVNPYVDKVILLNETDLSSEWSQMKGRKNIEQVIIGKRLRYCDLLEYTYKSVPPNTIVAYMNADIYLDETISEIFKVNITDRMFALLRWDTNESGESPKLFGPHPDSQDTWIVNSDSIKSRSWGDYSQFDYQLGRAGCDNRFTADMFANRFLLSNPAHTIKTYHIHTTQIRDYNKADIVPSKFYIYINPSQLLDMNQQTRCSDLVDEGVCEPFDVTINCPKESNGVTWCTMIARHNRFTWKHNIPKTYSISQPVYEWKKSFMTHNGIVFDRSSIYTGPHIEDFMRETDLPITFDLVSPKWHVGCMIAIPINFIDKLTMIDRFVLYYMSKVFNLLKYCEDKDACVIIPTFHKEDVKNFVVPSGSIQAIDWSPGVSIYAEKIIGYLPSMNEITKEDINNLRKFYNKWSNDIISKSCIILYNSTSDTKVNPFTYEFFEGIKSVLGSEWTTEAMDCNKSGSDAYNQLVGKQLCIFFGGEGMKLAWPKLWALPPGCTVLEFQNELKIDGEFQHMAAAADFKSTLFTLYKGSAADMRTQAMKQFTEWFSTCDIK